MGLLSMLGIKSREEKIEEALKKGAMIVDVRSPEEFKRGNVKGSVNIPLAEIYKKVKSLQSEKKTVITCCASGARSAAAAAELKKHGIEAINGGPWRTVATVKNQIK